MALLHRSIGRVALTMALLHRSIGRVALMMALLHRSIGRVAWSLHPTCTCMSGDVRSRAGPACTRMPPVNERPVTAWIRSALGFIVALGLVLGVWLRAKPLAGAFLFGDELHTLPLLKLDAIGLLAHFDAYGSGLALPILQKATVAVFGTGLPALRAVAFLPSLLLIWAVGALASQASEAPHRRAAAAVAALWVATASLFVFYGHFGRSYSLATLLCVGVLFRCVRAMGHAGEEDRQEARRDVVLIALLGGLACWAHLSSVFFLVGVGVGVVACAMRTKGVAGLVRAPAVHGLAAAAALALVLHLPAHEGLLSFVGRKGEQLYYGDFGAMDVLRVLVGSNAGAWASLALLPWAVWSDVRARGWASAPIVTATCVPPLLLAVVTPFGDAYAYARYLMPTAAAGAVLVALASVRLGARLEARFAPAPSLLPGVVLAALLFWLGPLGPGAPRLDRFANTYLALYRLPAFTAAPASAPAPYADFARADPGLVIVEAPPLPNRSVHYLAALSLEHGQDVRVGTFGPLVPGAPPIESDLYVDLSQTDALPGRFDRLVVHRRFLSEIRRYWDEVYADEPAGPDAAFMERHRIYGRNVPAVGSRVIEQLTELLGPPGYEDEDVVMWSRE
jgi:hypothetical protein